MCTWIKDILTAAFLGMVLPGILLNTAVFALDRVLPQEPEVTIPVETTQPRPEIWMDLRTDQGSLTRQPLEAYLVGVVLAEMPASFEPEALKAQAVAARTYTRKAAVTGGKHADGSICSQSACCQAHLTREAYLAQGGSQESLDKVRAAVEATAGQVLTYEGELIEATYFSTSGGSTEDAAAVWGREFPYLQSVPSPGEEQSSRYESTQTFTAAGFQQALGRELEGEPGAWFGITTYTEGGGVSTMHIGGQPYSGTQLRTLLGLPSTAFTLETEGDTICITSRGYGHRVGMSQYGAEAMALEGKTYRQILSHYYPGTRIQEISAQIPEDAGSRP